MLGDPGMDTGVVPDVPVQLHVLSLQEMSLLGTQKVLGSWGCALLQGPG